MSARYLADRNNLLMEAQTFMRSDRYKQIGTVGKAHGLEGVVRVHLESDQTSQRLTEGLVLYLQDRKGTLIPARIESRRTEAKRGSHLFFVKFDQFTSRSESEQFQDCALFIDSKYLEDTDDDSDETDSITGFNVTDSTGLKAVVRSVLENPAHLIIEMETGENRFLVPWVDAYVLAVDMENRELRCQNLTQLIDLQD